VRVLGIDLGSKRIGVAVSDRSATIASPLIVLVRAKSKALDHQAIARLVIEEEAVAIVVGLPINMSGQEGPASRAARAEAKLLTTVVNVPVHLHDERRTTVEADRIMMERKMNAKQRRLVVDKVAAAVLLQSWLDARSLQKLE